MVCYGPGSTIGSARAPVRGIIPINGRLSETGRIVQRHGLFRGLWSLKTLS
jgi:hypothetical protein